MSEEPPARLHDPTLRELTADLDGLRELLIEKIAAVEELAKERDKWYTERDKDRQSSVDKALTAAKEQTASSFAASKEAILKAEESQKAYNVGHNDLSRKMEAQYKEMVPQAEARIKWDSIDREIADLRTSRDKGAGHALGARDLWGFLVGIAGILLAAVTLLMKLR